MHSCPHAGAVQGLRGTAHVRLLLVAACVATLTTGPALANPHALLTIVPGARSVRLASPPPERALAERIVLRVAPKPPLDGEIEMPWIWQVLREQVYARMPRYDHKQKLSLLLSPVVVTSPSDTVPGLGIAGAF